MTAMIDAFLDAILPGDESLGLPPGRSVAAAALAQAAPWDEVMAALAEGGDFVALTADARLALVEKLRRKQARLANAVIVAALRAYYTDAGVLRALGAGAVPPFPDGNFLEDDDWSILEPVFERGPIWREVHS